MTRLLTAIASSGQRPFFCSVYQTCVGGDFTWDVVFDAGIYDLTITVDTTENFVNQRLRSIAHTGSVSANLTQVSGAFPADGTIVWKKNGSQVNSATFTDGQTSQTRNYTFTGCVKGDLLEVIIYPADYLTNLVVTTVDGDAEWKGSFDGLGTLTVSGNGSLAGSVDAVAVGTSVTFRGWKSAGGVAADNGYVAFFVNGIQTAGSPHNFTLGDPQGSLDFSETVTVKPGDAIEVQVLEG